MDKELLYKYLRCETSQEEESQIADWLEADAEHVEMFAKIRLQMEIMALSAPEIDDIYAKGGLKKCSYGFFKTIALAASVALFVFFGLSRLSDNKASERTEPQTITVCTKNAPTYITLSDGTGVWLNANTKMEFPAVFTGDVRKVSFTGEAMFDVVSDGRKPFVVETFACDVKVMGTQFNVIADESRNEFSTALFEGKVELQNKLNSQAVVMAPDMVVNLVDGILESGELSNRDEYLWTEGILSLSAASFDEIISKIEKYYGVTVVVERKPLPETAYGRLKIRIADGVEHAMRVLRHASYFEYEYDREKSIIIIK